MVDIIHPKLQCLADLYTCSEEEKEKSPIMDMVDLREKFLYILGVYGLGDCVLEFKLGEPLKDVVDGVWCTMVLRVVPNLLLFGPFSTVFTWVIFFFFFFGEKAGSIMTHSGTIYFVTYSRKKLRDGFVRSGSGHFFQELETFNLRWFVIYSYSF